MIKSMSNDADIDENLTDLNELDTNLFANFTSLNSKDFADIQLTDFDIFNQENTNDLLNFEDFTTTSEKSEESNESIGSGQKKRINGNRSRQKMELVELRQQVIHLEKQLQDLKKQVTISENSDKSTPPVHALMWKVLARNQMEARTKSSLENEKLRNIVEEQLKLAKSLERILMKRARTSITELDELEESKKRHKRFHSTSSFFKSDQLYQKMDLRALNASQIIKRIESLVMPNKTNISNANAEESDGLSMELIAREYLPFEYLKVSNTIWDGFKSSRWKLANGAYQARDTTHDTIVGETNLNISTPYHNYQGLETCIMRRYTQESQVVFVTEAMCTFQDRVVQTSGFIAVKVGTREESELDAIDISAALVHIRIQTYNLLSQSGDPVQSGSCADLLLHSYKHSIQEFGDHIESILKQNAKNEK